MEKKIRILLTTAISSAQQKGEIALEDVPQVLLELPKEKGRADLATNVAMILGRKLKISPALVANTLVKNLPPAPAVLKKVEVAGPGFINFFFADSFFQESLREMAIPGNENWEKPKIKEKILLEFVSANPTGPLNVVNARAAATGDALARLLEVYGHQAEREFYVNDEGSQIENLARSVEARYRQLQGEEIGEFSPDWYAGEYVKDLAQKIQNGFGPLNIFKEEGIRVYGAAVFTEERLGWLLNGFKQELLLKIPHEKERIRFLACTTVVYMTYLQKKVLEKFKLVFESWYFQSQLKDKPQKSIEFLKQQGDLYEQDGALWFRTTTFGDDKDRVLVRQDGQLTYFAADIAYHAYKKERGYDRLIDFLGPDHHGYIARTKASIQALGYPADTLEIYLIQLVTLVSGGKPFRMSKRAGEFITMDELLDEVGVDAARWYFLNRHRDSHLEFDLDLARLQSEENPLYYVQYAHARISSIIRMAAEQGIGVPSAAKVDLTPLTHQAEKELIKKMGQQPVIVKLAAENREPHHLTRYAVELAKTFHFFYTECRVLGEPNEKKLTEARLFLVSVCKKSLGETLGLMGISAPEKM